MKDIDPHKIIVKTSLPVMLQVKVSQNTSCTDLLYMGPLVWTCDDVNWKFWQIFYNNNTIGIEREDI